MAQSVLNVNGNWFSKFKIHLFYHVLNERVLNEQIHWPDSENN